MKNNIIKVRGDRIIGFVFLIPVLILIMFVSYIPFIWNLVLSFQQWDGFLNRKWIGFKNYTHLIHDQTALISFYHSAYLGVGITLFSVTIGILLAAFIYPLGAKEGAFFRFTLFTPSMVPSSIIAILFTFIFSPTGVLNQALESIGLKSLTHVWLGEPSTVLPSIVVVDVYKNMGITMMLCFTAMQMIPKSLFEASKLEGISYVRQFVLIVLPLIKPIIQLCVVLTLISAFRTFDSVRILTNGGPGTMSKTVSMYMIDSAFSYNQFGYAASMGALFTGMLLLTVLVARRLLRGESYEY
ncbi:carbohydrate ABC transporter permease [Paenibacillus aceris]|uniref:Raffinose/stachyose/melibiose transport system permease protein n=1 Tax=Paenibacillus aceris TaxID=869555 RepID=A0ABS4I204_9BACL|nr:sugar ABC transporter permease [Paenibacillus aceris]MBP1964957.1 raffinose/stachyose/melibiose transport system permease protein [Paenibacillus aceris]NHW35618.1 sugar ABC transporter permease [Paenibacillus aceris]